MIKVAVILADGFEELEALTPVDLLRRANFKVDMVGGDAETISESTQYKNVIEMY